MKIVILFLLFATTCIGVPFPQSQECPEGWLQNLGHCYLFGSDGLGSWAEAKAYCKEKGGFLAEIPNEETNTYLVDNMKTDSQLQKKWWWIGANDIANEGQFAWDNSGASLEFDAWNNNNPDDWQEVGGEDCAALYCNNKNDCYWNDLPCSGKYTIFEQWNLPAGGEGYPLCEIDTTQAGIKQLFGCTHGSNCVVGLLSYHNKYVVAENTGEANADRDRLGPYEKFSVTFDTKNKVQFKGYLGKYLVAEIDGTVNANQDQAVTGATWTVESGSNNNIGLAFKSTYGKYLVAENTGELNANRDVAGPYETFTVVDGNCYEDEIVPQEGKSCKHIEAWKNICDGSKTDCLLKGKDKCTLDPNCHGIMYHPGYWSKDNKGVLACTSKTLRDQPAKDWSVFLKVPCDEATTTAIPITTTAIPTTTADPLAGIKLLFGCTDASNCVVGLHSYHNKYVVAEENGKANANRDNLGPYEKFSVTFIDEDKVQFKGYHGKYLAAEIDGTVNANRDQAVSAATWTVESGSNGNIGLAFKSTYGKYLVAEDNGKLNANRDVPGPFETFKVVYVETRNEEDQLKGQWNQHLDKVGSLEIAL